MVRAAPAIPSASRPGRLAGWTWASCAQGRTSRARRPHAAEPAVCGGLRWSGATSMTFIRVYVGAYLALLVAASVAAWRSGLLDRLPAAWAGLVLGAAVALGFLLLLVSR